MLTLRELINFQMPSSMADLTSGPLLKLLFITIWAHQGRAMTYDEYARILCSGERTVYRAMRKLRDLQIIAQRERVPSQQGGGIRWEVMEHVVRRMLDAQEKPRQQKELSEIC